MQTIRYDITDGIATLTFDEPGSPVNTMCAQWQADMAAAAEQLAADRPRLRGVLLASAKKTFFAGADLKALMRLQPQDAPAMYAEIEAIKRAFRRIETLGIPVVACLNGSALGGGWEVALIAHHRIAVDDPAIRFGLPEVTLGLIPGATGITKMVRLLGLMAAQPYLMEGQTFDPAEAHRLGLVHQRVADAEALRPAALDWIAAHPEARQPWDEKDWRLPGGGPDHPKIAQGLTVAPAMLRQKTRGLYPAPEAVLCTMVEGARLPYEAALRVESRHLARVATGPVARNMVNTFFFDLNAVQSGRARPRDVPKWRPQRVGVLGAGMMGAGIAWAQASRGIATVLKDLTLDKAQAGKAHSERLAEQRIARGRMTTAERDALLERISATDRADDLAGCDLVIEAVFENRELKARVTQEVEPLLAPGALMASNTSTLPITGLAQASRDPARFIGIHFFSPVDKMRLVEIIRGRQTGDTAVAQAIDYVLALGKLPIVVNDSRGFYTSRTFGTYVMEGAAMLGEGIPAAVIENAAVAAGMPVGPLAVLDETALTLSVHVLEQTRADFAAEGRTYEATPGELLVERMVREFDRPGRAGGGGFYDYPATGRKHLWPRLRELFERPDAVWDFDELKDRLLFRQAVETLRCLSEGVLTSTADANIGSIFGIGFPGWTGGAMQFIYAQGVERFAARAAELASRHGPGFALGDKELETARCHQPRF